MPSAFDDQRVTILRQRVRGATPDPLLARLRLESLLGSADLRPSGLPPSAILCVRELRDPMPGTLRLNGYASRLPHQWEHALAASLDDIARKAAHPLHQSVPANAGAVMFADRAEMLACLALDWANGTLAHHWWWRSLLRDYDVNRTVWSAWLDAPQYAPPALAHLAARGEVVMVVRRMDEATVSALLRLILAAFNLRNLATMLEETMAGGTATISGASAPAAAARVSETILVDHGDRHSEHSAPPESPSPVGRIPAPWADRVPESLYENLTLPRRLLLGVALSLVRDPVRARTASFAWETQRWVQIENAGIIEIPSATSPPTAPVPEGTQDDETTDGSEQPPPLARTNEAEPVEARYADEQTQTERPQPDVETRSDGAAEFENISAESLAIQPAETTAPESSIEAGTPIETAIGGLFYLLNLAVHLGFYGDYATPRQHELELSIWDFVALVGAGLLGGTPSDPIWALLAQLAGRDADQPPGTNFSPQDIWRIDLRWLQAFPEGGVLDWSADGGRLRIQHPAGFLLVDIPLEGDLPPQLDEIRAAYGADFELTEANLAAVPTGDPLQRWLGWLMPYILARLCRALGLNDGGDPASLLCQHHARIFVTPAHVDVLLNLDTLPIEIRLAGLDRNPGWLPAAGRTITFHFESNGG